MELVLHIRINQIHRALVMGGTVKDNKGSLLAFSGPADVGESNRAEVEFFAINHQGPRESD